MSQNKPSQFGNPFGKLRDRLAGKLRRPDRTAQLSYYDSLIYQHRSFDVKGLTTQGVYTLELENVFVDLALVPQQRQRASSDPLRTISKQPNKKRHDLWAYISSEKSRTRNLVILGAPGSGKTTLLKHVTLTLAAETPDKKIDAIPILLFLRDHAAMIVKNPRYSIIDAIQEKLTLWQIEMPEDWFANALEKGQCLLMLDGLDEVADIELRKRVVRWVEQQMQKYAKNRFIITSRPFGYYSNPLKNSALLEIRPFTIEQVKKFINNWYLANEIMSYQRDDPGVRMDAKRGADDLLWRLRQVPVLLEMAVNPLLLTMIATVHRYRSSLPGRRVELYSEICEVFLGKRQQARGIQFDLTPAQKQRVLQSLAYYMMYHQQREIEMKEAAFAIQQPLKRVIGAQQNVGQPYNKDETTSEAFLKMIENSSGLLIEREVGVYSFAHLTFQEYLASAHILDQKLESELIKGVADSWWHETTRLYTAQADATNIIEACLSQKPASVPALMLAMECLDEAREVRPDLRNIVERFAKSVDHKSPEVRQITTEVVLSLRLRRMVRIDETKYVDTSLISNAEYQLFLNDAQLQHSYHQPDHWKTTRYRENDGQLTVTGVRPSDAVAFCDWLTSRDSAGWQYRLPTLNECKLGTESNQSAIGKSATIGYWYKGKSRYQLTPFTISDSTNNLEKTWAHRLEDDWDLIHNQPAENFKLIHQLITSRVKKRRYARLNPDRDLSQPLAAYPQLLQDNTRVRNRSQRNIATKLDQALVAAIRIVNNPNLDIARQLNLDDVIELANVLHQALLNATDLALPRGLTTEISRSAQYAHGMLGNRQVVMFQELDRALNKALRLTRELNKLVKKAYGRAQTRLRAESLAQLSELLSERERRVSAKITNAGEGSKTIISALADLYIDVALLEERMVGKLPALEGIRIVKVRQ